MTGGPAAATAAGGPVPRAAASGHALDRTLKRDDVSPEQLAALDAGWQEFLVWAGLAPPP